MSEWPGGLYPYREPEVDEGETASSMLLPDGKTCLDCIWWVRCSVVLGVAHLGQQECDFHPNRFQQRPVPQHNEQP